tara:strand:- start:1980 stop:2192 length:213 start_codon:yes stop_codon:yes gene_type:complete
MLGMKYCPQFMWLDLTIDSLLVVVLLVALYCLVQVALILTRTRRLSQRLDTITDIRFILNSIKQLVKRKF